MVTPTTGVPKDIRDKALALQAYGKQAQNLELERRAADIRIRAERRAGELLVELKVSGLLREGRPEKNCPRAGQFSLDDAGINRKQSMQWQQLAAMPEEEFDVALDNPDRHRHANRQIEAAQIVGDLTPMGVIPSSERVAR